MAASVVDLPEPVGPGDQHHPARIGGNLLEHLGGLEFLDGEDGGGDGAEHGRGAAVLVKGVDPEAGQPRDVEREVAFEEFLKVLALLVVHNIIDHRVHVLMLQHRGLDPADIAVHPNHRRQTRGQMQV